MKIYDYDPLFQFFFCIVTLKKHKFTKDYRSPHELSTFIISFAQLHFHSQLLTRDYRKKKRTITYGNKKKKFENGEIKNENITKKYPGKRNLKKRKE